MNHGSPILNRETGSKVSDPMALPRRPSFPFRPPRFVRRFQRALLILRTLITIALSIIVLHIRNRLRPA